MATAEKLRRRSDANPPSLQSNKHMGTMSWRGLRSRTKTPTQPSRHSAAFICCPARSASLPGFHSLPSCHSGLNGVVLMGC
eukprot:16446300-Heterocapsa_arctica.AAC.1